MNESPELTSQPAKIPSAMAWAARSAQGAIIATSGALVVFVVIGLISWAAIAGYHAAAISGVLGAAAGAILRGPGSRPARILGGGMGGALAGLAALSMGEMFPPATMQWALAGTAYGALFGMPVASLVGGFVGLLDVVGHRRGWPVGGGSDRNELGP